VGDLAAMGKLRIWWAVPAGAAVLVALACDQAPEHLHQEMEAQATELQNLMERVEGMEEAMRPLLEEHEERQAEAQQEAEEEDAARRTWASVTGRYRCMGGMVTGLMIRHGHAQIQMGGLEHLQGNQSYPARVRGDTLFITDAARGTVGWKVREGGKVLVPNSPIYAKRCIRR
jgi:hypothetical protein